MAVARRDAGDYRQNARTYAEVGIEDTYYLAFRDVAALLRRWRSGRVALDHGCGAGRSTRFLRACGFRATGIDRNRAMLRIAQQRDPRGDYRFVRGAELPFRGASFDLVFQSFVLIEIRTEAEMLVIFREIRRVVRTGGVAIIVTADRPYYLHDWASFSPKIRRGELRSGNIIPVRLRGTRMTFHDTYWTDGDYRRVFQAAGFRVRQHLRPRADGTEPYAWISERDHSCWSVYKLQSR